MRTFNTLRQHAPGNLKPDHISGYLLLGFLNALRNHTVIWNTILSLECAIYPVMMDRVISGVKSILLHTQNNHELFHHTWQLEKLPHQIYSERISAFSWHDYSVAMFTLVVPCLHYPNGHSTCLITGHIRGSNSTSEIILVMSAAIQCNIWICFSYLVSSVILWNGNLVVRCFCIFSKNKMF